VTKIYSLKTGDKLPDAILALAKRAKVATAAVEAIGGVSKLTLSYFNHRTRKYEEHRFNEYMEVTSLVGNVTLKDGKPFLHAHGNFGRKDLSVAGGHVTSAVVFPLLEVIMTPTKKRALRRFDDSTGLNMIYNIK
jgi:predicted DNA-binding protein with PD1-like motif